MKYLTRRELFTEICSKDTVQNVFRAWNNFTGEHRETKADKESVSKEDRELAVKESVLKLAQGKQKRLQAKKMNIRKEGNKS